MSKRNIELNRRDFLKVGGFAAISLAPLLSAVAKSFKPADEQMSAADMMSDETWTITFPVAGVYQFHAKSKCMDMKKTFSVAAKAGETKKLGDLLSSNDIKILPEQLLVQRIS